jgi:hypothetical protein
MVNNLGCIRHGVERVSELGNGGSKAANGDMDLALGHGDKPPSYMRNAIKS